MTKELLEKYYGLIEYIKAQKKVAVAFSGGVDSTFLLYAAREALKENTVALTLKAQWVPDREIAEAKTFCKSIGVAQKMLYVTAEDIPGFRQNPVDRCYLCKKAFFSKLLQVAKEGGFVNVAEGSNLDDRGDYRPGLKALAELKVLSPLMELGFTKSEIRQLSQYFNLPTFDKPSFACLASRFPYGDEITDQGLAMVDNAEQFLLNLGFTQQRVRIHGTVARIEVLPQDFGRFMDQDLRLEIYEKFKEFGFSYVSLDLKGYRTGSMNEEIKKQEV